jgi:4-amino-4-deoxy-L-arabinose transferase-like glycosyltransferase
MRIQTRAWLLLGILALVSCLAHLLVDLRIGIYGETSPTLTPWDGALAGVNALSIGVWAYALSIALAGDRTGLVATALFALIHGALGNGMLSLFIAPPPSLGFPYQDIAHFASLAFGTSAAIATWLEVRRTEGRVRAILPALPLALLVVTALVTSRVRRDALPTDDTTAALGRGHLVAAAASAVRVVPGGRPTSTLATHESDETQSAPP